MLNCDIREFGAIGDGVTMNTAAIQAAVDACSAAGGGTVTIAEGRYLSGRFNMRSGVMLNIEIGAVLLGSTNGYDFPEIETDFWKTEFAPRFNKRCFIYAEGCNDIGICGRGTIDCQGDAYCRPVEGRWLYERITTISPARMVFFIGCRNVTISDIVMKDPAAGWSYWICDCDDVRIRGIRIYANLRHPNSDGIHVNSSRDVVISDCILSCGDDAIIVRAYTTPLHEPKPCERVVVTNCVLTSRASGIRLAWYNDWIMRDCTFSNLVMHDTNNGIAMQLPKIGPTRGSDQGDTPTHIERIMFNNIVIKHPHGHSILFVTAENPLFDTVRDITFSNIRAEGKLMPKFIGRPDAHYRNITIESSEFTVPDGGSPEFRYVDGLRLNNVTFNN